MTDTYETQDDPRQVSDVRIHEIGARLIDLGNQLVNVGKLTENAKLRKRIEDVNEYGDEEHHDELDHELANAIGSTLRGLNSFRKDYANWERLTVEYALTRSGFTQRDVARMLGVGLSTVNRWAQHPLTYDD
jgi:hypothetical protein